MATFENARKTMLVAALPAFTMRAMNTISKAYRVWKNRREFYRLGEMTDAELADIGLIRADLRIVADLSLGADPTRRLRTIAVTRAEASLREPRRRRG